MYEQILYDVTDPVATITLNRPDKLNAWTDRMGEEVKHALAAAEADERVVGIVITGAGRGFCSGADLKTLEAISVGEAQQEATPALAADPGDPGMGEGFRKHYSYLMSIRKPIIAAINGPVAGMALPIALYCDLRFASNRASFSTAFAQRGLIAEWGLSWTLSRLCGPAVALDLLISSRKVEAPEADRIGLVNRVIPHDQLLYETRGYIVSIAEHCSPTSIAVMKREIYQHMTAELGDAYDESVRLMLESFGRPDLKEGVRSFLEKRPPKFPRIKG